MLYSKSKAKDILVDKDAIKTVVADTIDKMAAIVGATLGPGGRGVLIERDGLAPIVTKDGVTVAKSLGVANADANIVIDAAKEICLNTGKEAGDGTTTAIVFANALTKFGHDFLTNNPKYNPQRLVNELKLCYDTVILPYLKDKAIRVESEAQLKQVATISANGDTVIADAVVKAVMSAGDDGTVLIEEAQGNVMRVETMDGYVITSGLKELGQIGPIFINDRGGQQSKMDKGIVFLYDGSMNDLTVPAKIQEEVEGTELYGIPIIVMAHDFSDLVLETFAKNVKGGIMVVPLKTPMSGLPNSRSIFLQDMSAYTGAVVYDPGNIMHLDESGFGRFEHAKVNMYETVLTSTADSARVEVRVGELKAIAASAFSELDRMHLRAHIGKLTGGISTIWVGGASELEIREKKARVEDAVEAVRSAIAEGVVPGGCSVHLALAHMIMTNVAQSKSPSPWTIMANALQVPFTQLLHNCGEDVNEVRPLMDAYTKTSELPKGVFDADAHKMVDPFVAGIIEPAKVVRVSIGNALSVASLLITLGGIVCSPRDVNLENQLEMSKNAFKEMMSGGIEQ